MKTTTKKVLSIFLVLAILLPGIPVMTASADSVTPLAIVDYNSNSVIWAYGSKESAGAEDFIYREGVTAVVSESKNAVKTTAVGGDQFVVMNFDRTIQLSSAATFTFAILYKTNSALIHNAYGYYASNKKAGLVSTDNNNKRPYFTTRTLTINGQAYSLAIATLDVNASGITIGTYIHGVRVNMAAPTGKNYYFYGAGVFSSAEDAETYFSTDETSPVFPGNQSVGLSRSSDKTATVVSWKAATDNLFDADAITYRVFAASSAITAGTLGSATVIATVTGTTTATVRNLIANTGYYFAVEAADAEGNTVMWYGASPVTAPKLAVAPRAVVRYNGQSVLKDWAHKSESVAGGLITGNSTTASVNAAGTAVEAVTTSLGDGYFVFMNFDQRITASNTQSPYTFAVLYQTDGTLLNNQGFFNSSLTGDAIFKQDGSGVHVRPQLATQSITINGESYYLATTTLDMTDGEVRNGSSIYGIRVNLPQINKTYSFYSAGCFYTEEDAISYYQTQPFTGNTMTLEGDIGVNFFCLADLLTPSSQVTFTWGDKTVGPVAASSFSTVTVDGNTCYKLTCNVSAKEMNQIITATIRTNGTAMATQTASVAELAQAYLNDPEASDFLKNLMTSMLTYGAKAQSYFQYDIENLAVDSDPPALDWNDLPTENGSGVEYTYKTGYNSTVIGNSNLSYYGSSLVLQDKLSLRLFFNITGEVGDVTNASGSELHYLENPGVFCVYTIGNIAAADITEDITLLFDRVAVPFNPVTYIRSTLKKYESSADPDEQALCVLVKALYDYNQKAVAYFG